MAQKEYQVSEKRFVHLHLHDEYSLLDGFGKAETYAARALKLGQTHIALTNHGNIDGLIKFQNSCVKVGIKPLLGVELYVVKDLELKPKKESIEW